MRLAGTRFLVACSVYIALAGAQTAGMQSVSGLDCPLLEQTRMIASHVGGFEFSHRYILMKI